MKGHRHSDEDFLRRTGYEPRRPSDAPSPVVEAAPRLLCNTRGCSGFAKRYGALVVLCVDCYPAVVVS